MYYIKRIKTKGKGRGIAADSNIPTGVTLLEYKGIRRTGSEGDRLKNTAYVFFYKKGSKWYCIDATRTSPIANPAKLVNHSRRRPNMRPYIRDDRIFLETIRPIRKGEELLFDYGDRKSKLKWMKNS